jgi:Rrf2 family transcriptional regulator, iron-sulfur cluster assembly transcription factor
MKITALEEYGLRCALQLAGAGAADSATIPEIAEKEGLSTAYVGKLLNLLRQAGLVNSARGRTGGYTLSRPAAEIPILEVLSALGSPTWQPASCARYAGTQQMCVRTTGCAVRSLWGAIDTMVNQLLTSITLADLLDGEMQAAIRLQLHHREITQSLTGILGRIPGIAGTASPCQLSAQATSASAGPASSRQAD